MHFLDVSSHTLLAPSVLYSAQVLVHDIWTNSAGTLLFWIGFRNCASDDIIPQIQGYEHTINTACDHKPIIAVSV